jgi:hypothetical protein
MLRIAVYLSPVLLLAASVMQDAGSKEIPYENAKPYDDAEAYKVYAAVLPGEWPWSDAKAKTLVLQAETQPYAMCIEPDKEGEQIVGAAIADYKKLNAKRWMLQRQFEIARPYELIRNDEIQMFFGSGGSGWEAFYEHHPDSGGWIALSAVGFNASKNVAVVYAGHSCGSLCGGGTFHLLEKSNGKWVPLRLKGGTSCSWAS